MNFYKKIITLTVFSLAISLFLFSNTFATTTDGTIDTTNKYAWGNYIGWINFGCDECAVEITDSVITGYAWSPNYGWIILDPTQSGIINDGDGGLSGYAWGENIGWINFNDVEIDSSGDFSGTATTTSSGSIVFSGDNFALSTDWRPQSARPACNNSSDDDGDGLTDYPDDPGCSSLTDDNETDPSTGGGGGMSLPVSSGRGGNTFNISMNAISNIGNITNQIINILGFINSQANFIINNNSHILKIVNINMLTKVITLELQSTLKTITLEPGESTEVDIDNETVTLTYNQLVNNMVDLTVKDSSEMEEEVVETPKTTTEKDIVECTTITPGTLVKTHGNPDIWAVNEDLSRLYFANGDLFHSWNNDGNYSNHYSYVNSECMNSFEAVGALTPRPGTYLLKEGATDYLWAVLPNNVLTRISEEAAEELYGDKYNVDLADGGRLMVMDNPSWVLYKNYRTADEITDQTPHQGMLVKNNNNYYYVSDTMTLRKVLTTGLTANRLDTKWSYMLDSTNGFTIGDDVELKESGLSDRS